MCQTIMEMVEEGREEERAIGKKRERTMITRMLRKTDIQTVSDLTGITPKEIECLLEE